MVIGIDLGGMSAKAAVLNGDRLVGKSRVKTDANDSPEKTACALAQLARNAAADAGIAWLALSSTLLGC